MEQELAHGKRPPGILPVEDLLLYGQHSLLLIAHFPTTTTFSSSPGRALERLTSAFEALSYVHSKGISINLWRYIGFQLHEASFIGSYAYWADDPIVKADWLSPGCKTPSADANYAPIAGRRFPRRVITRFPPEPKNGRFQVYRRNTVLDGVSTPDKASSHPLVPSPPLVSGAVLLTICTPTHGRECLAAPLEFRVVKHNRSMRRDTSVRGKRQVRMGRSDP